MSFCCRHPSKLQDNMMPMSPDDYKALTQMVTSRDIAVVSAAAFNTSLIVILNVLSR